MEFLKIIILSFVIIWQITNSILLNTFNIISRLFNVLKSVPTISKWKNINLVLESSWKNLRVLLKIRHVFIYCHYNMISVSFTGEYIHKLAIANILKSWNCLQYFNPLIYIFVSESEWKLILVKQRSLVGKLPCGADIYKINKISVLPLCLAEVQELDIEVSSKAPGRPVCPLSRLRWESRSTNA